MKQTVYKSEPSYDSQSIKAFEQLNLGMSEQVFLKNVAYIIKSHKQSCKELLMYCDKPVITQKEVVAILSMKKQITAEINNDLNKINFIYPCYIKCLNKFLNIIKVNTEVAIDAYNKDSPANTPKVT